MSIDEKEVKKIAKLACLHIEADAVDGYATNLSNIFALVEQMNSVDTTGVEPMAHPLDMVQRLRPDKVLEQDHRDKFQALAPKIEAGLYLVPKVIE